MKNVETITTDQAAAVAEQGARAAPEKASSKKGARLKKGAPKGQTGATGTKTGVARKKSKGRKKASRPARPEKAVSPRAESKGAKILEMVRRPKGVTLAEIMKAADWQAHCVRGFISTAAKKHGITIESSKNEAGHRVYRIAQ